MGHSKMLQISTDEVYSSLIRKACLQKNLLGAKQSLPPVGKNLTCWPGRIIRPMGCILILFDAAIISDLGSFLKSLPLMILRAMARQSLPVYGDGLYKGLIYVEDHCSNRFDSRKGRKGEVYMGGFHQKTNLASKADSCQVGTINLLD